MSDDRNNGPGSAAPPPMAAAPPPVPPAPQPAPAPYYAPPARSGAGRWPLFVLLAFVLGVGGTILTLWLTGDLWNSRSSYSSGNSVIEAEEQRRRLQETMELMNVQDSAAAPAPAPAPTTSGSMPTAATLVGSWSTTCNGNTNGTMRLYSDGSAQMDGEGGTWSLNGSYVDLTSNRGQRMSLYWEMVGSDSARVRRSGDSQVRTIYRCS